MAWIDTIALWIGYVIMAAMGMGVAAFVVGLVLEEIGRKLRNGLSLRDIQQAVEEWRKAHPERAARFDSRKSW
ncbi:hypothetical protein GCM10007933_21150 [Zoogloea oryzae]|uniref:Uncharacterized protein n=2 Tax=Zoogloea oryzae TaxID=310767 RepID=A0ABQ6FDT8_9RHOO|nr:hypothetical protein GCM10007933_21150 [Zoogloea oryzae]